MKLLDSAPIEPRGGSAENTEGEPAAEKNKVLNGVRRLPVNEPEEAGGQENEFDPGQSDEGEEQEAVRSLGSDKSPVRLGPFQGKETKSAEPLENLDVVGHKVPRRTAQHLLPLIS